MMSKSGLRITSGVAIAMCALAPAIAAPAAGPRTEAPMVLQPGDNVLVIDADTALRFRVESGEIVSADHRAWPRVPNDPGVSGPVATCFDDPAVRVGICEAGSLGASAMIYVVATKTQLETIQLIGRQSTLPSITLGVASGTSRLTTPDRSGEVLLTTNADGSVTISGDGGAVDPATGCWRDARLDLSICDDPAPGAPAIRVTAAHAQLQALYILSDPGAPIGGL